MSLLFRKYWDTFIRQADFYIWSRQPQCLPKCYKPLRVNRLDEIEAGHKIPRDKDGNNIDVGPDVKPLEPFLRVSRKSKTMNKLKALRNVVNGRRRANARRWNRNDTRRLPYWIFPTYADPSFVTFVIFDFDFHAGDKAEQCYSTIRRFRELTRGMNIVWTCSPGTIKDGERIFGLYAVVPLRSIQVGKLWHILTKWLDHHGLDLEECFDAKHKAVRIPGQWEMPLASVNDDGTFSPLYPESIRGDQQIRGEDFLVQFAEAWNKCAPNSIEHFLLPGETIPDVCPNRNAKKAPVPKKAKATQQPINKPAPVKWDGTGVNPNAFFRMVGRKRHGDSILSPIIRKYDGRPEAFAKIVHEACERYRDVCLNTPYQDTISNPPALLDIATRATKVMLNTYISSKGRVVNEQKETADIERFKNSARLDRMSFLALSIFKNVPMLIRAKFWRVYELLVKYNGRVAMKLIFSPYKPEEGIFSPREWRRYGHIFYKLFKKVAKHAKGECSQYVFVDRESHANHGHPHPPTLPLKEYSTTHAARPATSGVARFLDWWEPSETVPKRPP